jgi:hypothetical protein
MTVLPNATHLIEGQITSVNNINIYSCHHNKEIIVMATMKLLIQQTAANLSSEICYDTVIESH